VVICLTFGKNVGAPTFTWEDVIRQTYFWIFKMLARHQVIDIITNRPQL